MQHAAAEAVDGLEMLVRADLITRAPEARASVGQRVDVYWRSERRKYRGTIREAVWLYHVDYDDGDSGWESDVEVLPDRNAAEPKKTRRNPPPHSAIARRSGTEKAGASHTRVGARVARRVNRLGRDDGWGVEADREWTSGPGRSGPGRSLRRTRSGSKRRREK